MKEFFLKLSIFVSGCETKSLTHLPFYVRHTFTLKSTWWAISLIILIPFFCSSCVSTGPIQPDIPAFNNTALTTTLERGISTGADVKEKLGEPTGKGGFLYPTDTEERIVWYYEHIKITGVAAGKPDIHQDVLMVFLKEDIFDGFLWFSDARKDW